MFNISSYLLRVLVILPLVTQVVRAVEEMFGAGGGSTKRDLAEEVVLRHLYSSGVPVGADLRQLVADQIEQSVATNNAAGLFPLPKPEKPARVSTEKKSDEGPSPVAPPGPAPEPKEEKPGKSGKK